MHRRVDNGEPNRPPVTAADLFNSNQAYEAQQEATVGSWRMADGGWRSSIGSGAFYGIYTHLHTYNHAQVAVAVACREISGSH